MKLERVGGDGADPSGDRSTNHRARPVQTRFDRFFSETQPLAGLGGAQAFDLAQHEHRAVAVGQCIQQNWLAQGTLRFVGERFIDNANTLRLPSYAVVDAGVRRSLSHNVAIDFRVTNLNNAFYAYNFSSNGLGGGNWNVGQPRSFEVSLTAGF